MARLAWRGVVDRVYEKRLNVGGKLVDGEAVLITEPAGWWIQLGNMALYAGDTKPGFKQGDEVKLTLEHLLIHDRVNHTGEEEDNGGSSD